MQRRAGEPRQGRKAAAVARILVCRRVPGLLMYWIKTVSIGQRLLNRVLSSDKCNIFPICRLFVTIKLQNYERKFLKSYIPQLMLGMFD